MHLGDNSEMAFFNLLKMHAGNYIGLICFLLLTPWCLTLTLVLKTLFILVLIFSSNFMLTD